MAKAKKKLPVKQRDYKVGNKRPPKEHQFKPGESDNPNGPPVRRAERFQTRFAADGTSGSGEMGRRSDKALAQLHESAEAEADNGAGHGEGTGKHE